MAFNPQTHGDVRIEIENAQGPFSTLVQRLAMGEQTIRSGGPLWTVGRYIGASLTCQSLTTQAAVADRMYLVPVYFTKARTLDQIGVNVSTALAGNVRMGIYNVNKDTGQPTTVLADGGTSVSTGTTGAKTQTLASVTVHGLHWLAITASAAATFTATAAAEMAAISGAPSLTNAPANHVYVTHSQATALPDLTSTTLTLATGNVPAVMVRAV